MICQPLLDCRYSIEELKLEFQALVQTAWSPFHRWLRKQKYLYDDREELCQRTLVTAWSFFPRWRRHCTFLTLLISIARIEQKKLISEKIRYYKNNHDRPEFSELFDWRLSYEIHPEYSMDIDIVLRVLKGSERIAVKMHMKGYRYREIADFLGEKEEGIKKKIQRAIIKMRNHHQHNIHD